MRKAQILISSFAMGMLLLFSSCGGDSWIETYDPDLDEPYGLSLLPEILKVRYPDADYNALPRNWTVNGIDSTQLDKTLYVAVGNGLGYTFSEAEVLAGFIRNGGEAFIATKEASNKLLKHVTPDSCLGYKSLLPDSRFDSIETVISATGTSFLLPMIRKEKGSNGLGNHIDGESYCFDSTEHLLMLQRDTLGHEVYHGISNASQPIMTRFAYGEGHLTLLSYPRVLTNVYATDSLGRIAIEEVLKLLPKDIDHLAFDYDRRTSEYAVMKDNMPKSDGPDNDTSILKHVLARPPLAMAWYLLLLGSVVFLIFGAKRRQRLIPLEQPRRNTTHEHLGNISRLYLSAPNNRLMAGKQFALFEAYCNRRFGLRPLQNEADFERFSKMAGVNAQHLETLKRYQSTVARNQPISNTGFVSIVRILQEVYKGIGRRFD